MAKGAQDWVARTDVLLQTLSELIVRYKYGAMQQLIDSGIANYADTGWYSLLSVSGKGVLYGGYLAFSKAGAETWIIRITIDGVLATFPSCSDLNLLGLEKVPKTVCSLLAYDTVNYYYNIKLPEEITFESSLVIEYYMPVIGLVSWYRGIMYATI